MNEPAHDDQVELLRATDPQIQRLLGTFDTPAFARRGHDLEQSLARLDARCRAARRAMLEMVHLRLRQWARVATGFSDYADTFGEPLTPLFESAQVESPQWAREPGPPRRRRGIAADLRASVSRFNARWTQYLVGIDLEPINLAIQKYNHYYTLEKECVVGSARLAARFFRPMPLVEIASLMGSHPLLNEPTPATRRQF